MKRLSGGLCVTLLLLLGMLGNNLVLSAPNDDMNINMDLTKEILVKYNDNEIETNIHNKYNYINNKQLYNQNINKIKMNSSDYEHFIQDPNIEIVEEDGMIQLLDTMIKDISQNNIEINEDNVNQTLSSKCSLCKTDISYSMKHLANINPKKLVCNDCIPNFLERINNNKNKPIEVENESIELSTDIENAIQVNNTIYNLIGDTESRKASTINDLSHDYGVTGKNIKVAIFDTGIDLNHVDLNVAGGISFVDDVSSYDDDHGHGTLMASILASKINGVGYVGVAPDIELYSVKVLDNNGIGSYSNIIQGIYWAIDNEIDIITLNFKSNQSSEIFSETVKLAAENNILIVTAAVDTQIDEVVYSKVFPYIVQVGNLEINETESNTMNHKHIGLNAPGLEFSTLGRNNQEQTISGTSPAAQYAAGMAALLWSTEPNLSVEEVKSFLFSIQHGDLYNEYGLRHLTKEANTSLSVESEDTILEVNQLSEYINSNITPLADFGCSVGGPIHEYKYMYYGNYSCEKGGYIYMICLTCNTILSEYYGSGGHAGGGTVIDDTHNNPPFGEGHYAYDYCAACGGITSSFYTLKSDCISCTTPPIIKLMNEIKILGLYDPEYKPELSIFGNDSYYKGVAAYINGTVLSSGNGDGGTFEWGTVKFSKGIKASNLPEGENHLKFVAKCMLGPEITLDIKFLVDKSAPEIESFDVFQTHSSVTLGVNNARDNISGLDYKPYRFTLNGIRTDWIPHSTYTYDKLSPNSVYQYLIEVRDMKGNIHTTTGTLHTKSETSNIQMQAISNSVTPIKILDNNPHNTLYRIEINYIENYNNITKYIDKNGNLVTSETWILLNTNKVVNLNLLGIKTYSITVSSKNEKGVIIINDTFYIKNVVDYPQNLRVVSNTEDSIVLAWNHIPDITLYKVVREKLSKKGEIIETKTFESSQSHIIDTDISADTKYQYRIYRKLGEVYGPASPTLVVNTYPSSITNIISSRELNSSVVKGEEFSVQLPVKNVEVDKYILKLSFNSNEVSLLDACEFTKELEQATCYLPELHTLLMIKNEGNNVMSISIMVDNQNGYISSGIMNGIRLKSKVSGNIKLTYEIGSKY